MRRSPAPVSARWIISVHEVSAQEREQIEWASVESEKANDAHRRGESAMQKQLCVMGNILGSEHFRGVSPGKRRNLPGMAS
jgi:hypothetical protein